MKKIYFDSLPEIISALDYHITENMRAIYYEVFENSITIIFLLKSQPSRMDNFLMCDVEGLLMGDNLLKEIKTQIVVNSETPLWEIDISGYRVFARNEDDEDDI